MGFSSPQKIKITEILACADLTFEEPYDLVRMICYLDDIWIKDWAERNPSK